MKICVLTSMLLLAASGASAQLTYTAQTRSVSVSIRPGGESASANAPNLASWSDTATISGGPPFGGSASASQTCTLTSTGVSVQAAFSTARPAAAGTGAAEASSNTDVTFVMHVSGTFTLTGQMRAPSNFGPPFTPPVRLVELSGPGVSILLSGAFNPNGSNGPGMFSHTGFLSPGTYRFHVQGTSLESAGPAGPQTMSGFDATLSIRGTPCNSADVGGLGSVPISDGALTVDDVVVYLNAFFGGDSVTADIALLGGLPGRDGRITPDDLVYFLSQFFAGCP